MRKDELQELYQNMKAVEIFAEAEQEEGLVGNMSKPKLVQVLLVMTKFSEKFLKMQDEETLKLLVQTFMNLDKTRMKKDLGITNLMKPQSNE